MDDKKKINLWREKETVEMLEIVRERHILKLLDSKTKRNKNIFESIAKDMAEKGFSKNADQIRAKFKAIKSDYYKIKRGNQKSGAQRQTCDFFDILEDIFSHRPALTSEGQDTSLDTSEENCAQLKADTGESSNSTVSEDTPAKKATKTFNMSSKKTYQRVVESFSKEWKETQENLVKEMNEKDTKYLGSVQKMLEHNRTETAKMLEEDRKETARMLSHFITAIKPQPLAYWDSQQNADSVANSLIQRPFHVRVPVSSSIFSTAPHVLPEDEDVPKPIGNIF